ncbi:MAG: DUF3592 domain-containing protein [Betaproteobacteria bacterium]|nr:DUF3592 domain-containing protein [Betaproteobacteria bacterium]
MLFPVTGAVLLAIALITAISTHRFSQSASRADGTVVELAAGGAHPVIEFTPPGEQPMRLKTSGFIYFAVGDRVTVLYQKDASDPAHYRTQLDHPGARWFGPALLCGIGGGLLLAGLYTRRKLQNALRQA